MGGKTERTSITGEEEEVIYEWNHTYIFVLRTWVRSEQVVKQCIVNRGKWLWSPANVKVANKEAKIYVGKSMTVHIFCFELIHNAWIT